jgi:hypothetical protein
MSAIDIIDSGIAMPRLADVRPVDADHHLVKITWAEGDRRGKTEVVDLSPLIYTHRFYVPLRNDPTLFNTVHLLDNGEAIAWGDDSIDMAADSIERLAAETMSVDEFRAFLTRNNLTQEKAAAILGRSRRSIASYANQGGIPRIVALACRGYEVRPVWLFAAHSFVVSASTTATFSPDVWRFALTAQRPRDDRAATQHD